MADIMAGDESAGLEWALVAPGKIVVATADRAWIHRSELPGDVAFSLPMQGPGAPDTTRSLLDGAVGAGQRAAEEARKTKTHAGPLRPPRPPPMSDVRWVWRLAGYYRTTNATPRLMLEAAARFKEAGRDALARWAARKAVEERGHDELALRDIRALGYDAEAVVAALLPETAATLVRYFTRCVYDDDPVRCVGYAYALERLALTRGSRYVESIESILPKGVDATRCLRVHSRSGSDAKHVEEVIALVASLSPAERAQIALASYETTVLCYLPADEGFVSEDALKQALSSMKVAALTPVNDHEQDELYKAR